MGSSAPGWFIGTGDSLQRGSSAPKPNRSGSMDGLCERVRKYEASILNLQRSIASMFLQETSRTSTNGTDETMTTRFV